MNLVRNEIAKHSSTHKNQIIILCQCDTATQRQGTTRSKREIQVIKRVLNQIINKKQ